MPIDPNIALQVRPMELADPLQQYGRAVQLRSLIGQGDLQALQMQEARRSAEETRAYNEAYKGALNPDGTIDRIKLTSALAGGGLGSKLPAVTEQFAKADKLGLETKELQGKVDAQGLTRARDQFKALNNGLGALMRKPDLSHQDVIQTVGGLAAQGLITPEQGQEAIRQMPGNPAALQQFLQRRAMMNVEADKMIELMLPKLQQVNDGQRTQFVDTNPMSNPGGPAPIQMQATPDAVMRDGTTRAEGAANRGVQMTVAQMTDARARELAMATRETAAEERARRDADKRDVSADTGAGRLSNDLNQSKIPQVGSSIRNLNAALAQYTPESAPGLGYAKNLPMADFFLSDAGKDIKSSAQAVANDLLSMYSGMAVTIPEAERRDLESMKNGKFSAEDFYRAWPKIAGRYNQVAGNIAAGATPEARSRYLSRPGAMNLDPVLPTQGKGKPPASPYSEGATAAPAAAPAPAATTDWRSAYGSKAAAVGDARTAIAQGAPKAEVIRRLEAAGITDHGIK